MKPYLLLSCLSVLLISSPVMAQDVPEIPPPFLEEEHHPHMDRKSHFESFAKELGLTPEQQKQAQALHEKMKEDMKPVKEEMKKLRQQAHQIREANKTAFEALLTEEQKEKLKQIIPPHKEGKFKRRHNKKRGFFPHTPK